MASHGIGKLPHPYRLAGGVSPAAFRLWLEPDNTMNPRGSSGVADATLPIALDSKLIIAALAP